MFYCISFGILNTSFNIKSDLEATNPFKALNLFFPWESLPTLALQQLATAEECIADKWDLGFLSLRGLMRSEHNQPRFAKKAWTPHDFGVSRKMLLFRRSTINCFKSKSCMQKRELRTLNSWIKFWLETWKVDKSYVGEWITKSVISKWQEFMCHYTFTSISSVQRIWHLSLEMTLFLTPENRPSSICKITLYSGGICLLANISSLYM